MARSRRPGEELIENEQQRRQREDFSWLMSERAGRRLVWRLLAEAGVFRSSFVGNAEGTFFAEGRRAVGLLWLTDATSYCRDEFVLMLREHEEDANVT